MLLQSKPSDRFFKLPIEKVLSRVPNKYKFAEFNLSQAAMLKGLEEHRFWVHISARRTGKSIAAAILAFAKLLEPDKQVIVVAPDYKLSSIIWDYMVEIIEFNKIETIKFNQKDHVIQLINNSTFRLLSANNRTSLVGRAAHLLIVDEAALIPDSEYFDRDLRPALSTYPDSRCLFISTPRGKNHYLYEFYMRGQNPEFANWGSDIFTWEANPLLSEKDIEESRRTVTKKFFLQEYYCDWATFENQIYDIHESHLQDLRSPEAKFRIEPGDDRFIFIAGLDMGYRDATAMVILAGLENETGIDWFVIEDYEAEEGTTSIHAEYIKAAIELWGIDYIYIDSAAQQSKADLAYDYEIFTENANKSVNDGIAYLQVLVEQEKIHFDEEYGKRTYEAMSAYKWNSKTEKQKPLHDKYSHLCDAIRYAVYTYSKASAVSVY